MLVSGTSFRPRHRKAKASGGESPTVPSSVARGGHNKLCALNVLCIAAQMWCWLSTNVPSQSKITNFKLCFTPPDGRKQYSLSMQLCSKTMVFAGGGL